MQKFVFQNRIDGGIEIIRAVNYSRAIVKLRNRLAMSKDNYTTANYKLTKL